MDFDQSSVLTSGVPGAENVAITMTLTSGRGLVATKSFEKGETIFKEDILAYGPSDKQDGHRICAMCFKNTLDICVSCHFPICSKQCQHLHSEECRYLNNCPHVNGLPKWATVFRLLLKKGEMPDKWKKISLLEDNCSKRSLNKELNCEHLFHWFQDIIKVTLEEINQAYCILDR